MNGHIKDASDEQLQEIYDLVDGKLKMPNADWDWILSWAEGKVKYAGNIKEFIRTLEQIREGRFYT